MTGVMVSHPNAILHGTIRLPSSKSISNRALLLQQVCATPITLHNLSTADDTVIMQQALQQGHGILHLKNAGTCMRFLTAFFAANEGTDVTLLCDERMEQRPIKELVDALRQLGATITYLRHDGYPPLRIQGKKLKGGTITVSAASSSQYVSALMMIAPLCEGGLTIRLNGAVTSFPYIDMTARMMTELGVDVLIKNEDGLFIEIPEQHQKLQRWNAEINPDTQTPLSKDFAAIRNFFIEPDWSAASYWYEMAALSADCDLLLEGLKVDSLQGDAIIHQYMELFGVATIAEKNGLRLQKKRRIPVSEIPNPITNNIHLAAAPDLAPALAVTAAAVNIPTRFTGVANLAIKESNRLEALHTELTKLGYGVRITPDELEVTPSAQVKSAQPSNLPPPTSVVSTYSDHRMAMAFAPLALVMGTIVIENPEVVEKSYPHFWEDLKRVGFRQEMV